jgi:hypothetical protein
MTTADEKQRYLVLYDYGQGGVWAFVWARSAAEIGDRFRALKVVEKMPPWLTGDALAKTEERMTFDVDAIQPDDWIAPFLRSNT